MSEDNTKKEEANVVEYPIASEAAQFIKNFFKEHLSSHYLFHDFRHTTQVVKKTREISAYYKLPEEEIEILILAAWFHDSGYVEVYEGHEAKSCEIARKFLLDHEYPEDKIKKIERLIMSTQKGHVPANLHEEILHDADISHTGRSRFFRRSSLLRLEWENLLKREYSDPEWEKMQLDFLISDKLYTRYAKQEFGSRKAKNIQKQKERIEKAEKRAIRINTGKDFGRGIDTLYRTTFRNHINLSEIADGKANMIITLNTIVLSVIITFSGAGFTFSDVTVRSLRFLFPILVLMLGSLLAVVFAVLSARPKVTQQSIDAKTLEKKETSLLYFGNFLNVEKASFVEYLSEIKKNQAQLYDSMAVDLYSLGMVLKKKYKLLTWSYNVFMAGLVLAVVGFFLILILTIS